METVDNFTIIETFSNKKQYLPLLLIGDESESMIDRYLDSGTLYVGFLNRKSIAICVIVSLDSDTVEIKILPSKLNTESMDTVAGCLNMWNHNIQTKELFLELEKRPLH